MIGLVGDLHLDTYRPFSTVDPSQRWYNSRLYKQIEVALKVRDICRENKIHTLIFLGDMFTGGQEQISKVVMDAAAYVVKEWAAAVGRLILIAGNHDYYKGISLLEQYHNGDNIYVVDKQPLYGGDDGVEYVCAPYNIAASIGAQTVPYFFGHEEVNGFRLNVAQATKNGLPFKIFESYKKVVLGHLHERQEGHNIHYAGCVMQNSFHDMGETKGMHILSPRSGRMKFIEIPSAHFIYVSVLDQKGMDKYMRERGTEHYYKVLIKNDGVKVPIEFGQYNEVVEYDFDIAPINREAVKHEAVEETIMAWIDNANTNLNKEEIKKRFNQLWS